MAVNRNSVRRLLESNQFQDLFIEELGWDECSTVVPVEINGVSFELEPVAQKRGFVALCCKTVPDSSVRAKIESRVSKDHLEHIIIFSDESRGLQVWQWVKREPNKPVARREHVYKTSQAGESLIQKLAELEVSLEEEEETDLLGMTSRARKAFDLDKVTKKFYDIFKKQHAAFLKAITGISEKDDREWYASIMLNRLMFTYFIQAKGYTYHAYPALASVFVWSVFSLATSLHGQPSTAGRASARLP